MKSGQEQSVFAVYKGFYNLLALGGTNVINGQQRNQTG